MFTNSFFYLFCVAIALLFIFTLIVFVGKISASAKSKLASVLCIGLAVYWFLFGDYFSTVAAHKQLCDSEAGFKIYVTPEQWAAENPGVLETLEPIEKFTLHDKAVLGNQRIGSISDIVHLHGVAIQKNVEKIIDIKSGQVLAEDVDFSRGYGAFGVGLNDKSYQIWMYSGSCYPNVYVNNVSASRTSFFKKLKTKWGR